ncbi:TPA: single-stranded DNA-binding protein, partial [Staphylococcus aureus]|nr:single-stranded DNA-binding protein [Staphylococcus aureus]
KTDKQKAEENNGAQQQTSMSQQSNPFGSSGQFGYDDQDLAF